MHITNISGEKNTNFGMLKKNQLNQFQKHFTEKFKSPLEKFDSYGDLERWSAVKFLNMKDESRNAGIGIKERLKDWEKGLNALTYKIKDSSLWQVIAYDGIKKIKDYIPLYEEDIMLDTINKIYKKLNPHHNAFNFVNEYSDILKEKTLTKLFPKNSERTGWLKFSESKNPDENKEVINDIRRASIGTNWCTKSNLFARLCIDNGNFYIYYKNGKPMIGIRTQEIDPKMYGFPEDKTEITCEVKNRFNKVTPNTEDFFERFPNVKYWNSDVSMLE